jgi:hypothetical protein
VYGPLAHWAVALVVAGLAAALSACSVPREAELTSTHAGAATASPVPSPLPPSAVDPATSASLSASPSPSPSPSVAPAPSPKRRPVRPPRPHPVAGYELSTAPRAVANPLADVKGAGDVFGPVTVRSVAKGGTSVGLLFLFAVRPEYVDNPAVASVVLPRVTAGISRGGMPVTMQRLSGQRVAVASSPKTGTIVVWLSKGVLAVIVSGRDASLVTGYARAYIAARGA